MTDNEIIRILPTLPPHEVLKAAMECPELHPSFISFKRVSVETGRIEWQELMTPEDIDRIAKASKRRWGALCHCTFCGENFYNIPQIPMLATGGIATAPTLAMVGEGGEPEAVLPLSKLAQLLDDWDKKPKPGSAGGGESIVFSPVFNFYGGTPSREEAMEAGRVSFAEFKRLYRRMKDEERRKQFSPA